MAKTRSHAPPFQTRGKARGQYGHTVPFPAIREVLDSIGGVMHWMVARGSFSDQGGFGHGHGMPLSWHGARN